MSTLPVYNPATPFTGKILGSLQPGLMIRIKGRINGHDHRSVDQSLVRVIHKSNVIIFRCQIDFVHTPASNQDVMFHLSLRPKERVIVRNHFHNGKWGQEERDGPAVRANETFEIMISADREFYKLALNGQYLGNFRHRLPLYLVDYVKVSGVCGIDHILIERDMSYQQMNVNVNPFPQPVQDMGIRETHYATPSAPARPIEPQMMVSEIFKSV